MRTPLRLRVRLWKLDWEKRLERPRVHFWLHVWKWARKHALRAVRDTFPDEYDEMRRDDEMTPDDMLLDAHEALIL